MIDRKIIKLSESVNIVQIFETDENGQNVGEYMDIEIHEPSSGRVHTISFVGPEISSESLRTAANEIDTNRVVAQGYFS